MFEIIVRKKMKTPSKCRSQKQLVVDLKTKLIKVVSELFLFFLIQPDLEENP